jgi:hypothetical protein
MPTDVAQLAFASAGAIIILFLMARRGALTGTERNAVGTAAFGLFYVLAISDRLKKLQIGCSPRRSQP